MSNMAFFPFFPYIWKWLSLDGFQISILNLVVFSISFIILMGKEKYSTAYLLIVSSLPCFIFFFLPYSESWFFLFGTMLIIGYRRESRMLQVLGLFGCCLTRSVSTFFIPAVIITEILAYKASGISRKTLITNITINISACLAGILSVVLIQGLQTGKWFYYIEVQKYWQRHWLFPSFPLTTISPNKVLGIDSVALMLGLIGIYFSVKYCFSQIKSKITKKEPFHSSPPICKSIYFSILFLAAIAIIDTCFTYDINGKTNMQCMNRHLMCTSFALCFLNWLNNEYRNGSYDIYFIAGFLVLGIFATGIYAYGHHLIYYILFVSSFFLYRFFPAIKPVFLLLFLFNIFFLVIFYQDFLNGLWIG